MINSINNYNNGDQDSYTTFADSSTKENKTSSGKLNLSSEHMERILKYDLTPTSLPSQLHSSVHWRICRT